MNSKQVEHLIVKALLVIVAIVVIVALVVASIHASLANG